MAKKRRGRVPKASKKAEEFIDQMRITTKVDDPAPRVYIPRSEGKRSGMGVLQFWAALFEANENLPKNKKMTDAAIARAVIEEFPERKIGEQLTNWLTRANVKPTEKVTVNRYRTQYNENRLSGRIDRRVVSKRYTKEGHIAHPRTGVSLSSYPREIQDEVLRDYEALQRELEDQLAEASS